MGSKIEHPVFASLEGACPYIFTSHQAALEEAQAIADSTGRPATVTEDYLLSCASVALVTPAKWTEEQRAEEVLRRMPNVRGKQLAASLVARSSYGDLRDCWEAAGSQNDT